MTVLKTSDRMEHGPPHRKNRAEAQTEHSVQTITQQKQPSAKQQGRKRQKAQQQSVKQEKHQEQTQQEGLYAQVKDDEALRAHHTAKLLDTPGYSHLTVEEAGGMVEQMLRLSCLMYEMLLEQGKNPLEKQYSPEKTAAAESRQNQTRQQRATR